MTDEQWLWLFVNESADSDEKLESLCEKCRSEVTSKDRCTRCGKHTCGNDIHDNPNFDAERFEKLQHE